MAKSKSGWVVYMRDEYGNFVRLTKPFKKKEQAEQERERMMASKRRKDLGVGFVR